MYEREGGREYTTNTQSLITYLKCWRKGVSLGTLGGNGQSPPDILLPFIDSYFPHLGQELLKDDVQGEDVFTEPHHTTAAYGCKRGKPQVLDFKHDADLRRREREAGSKIKN